MTEQKDSRIRKMAELVVNYCVRVKPGENVIISGSSQAEEFIEELYKVVILAKANPLVRMYPKNTNYFFFKHASRSQLTNFPAYWFKAVKEAQAYISVESEFNTRELSSCDPKKIALRAKTVRPISDYMVNTKDRMKYVIVEYPSLASAIEADMSIDEWQDFIFSSCLIDWTGFLKRFVKINRMFHNGKEVHLVGDNVDLTFSIGGKNSMLDDGRENMPGGEIYMAPQRTSMKGWIKFEYPAFFNGNEIRDIFLKFRNGKVVEYSASKGREFLKGALETDKNASYAGEFGIGVNPKITRYTNNILFDEKISGTVHLALGMAYQENGGGNDSALHWDIIKDMRKAKITLDGKVVQENGQWKV